MSDGVALEPLRLGRLISGTFWVFFRNPALFVMLALVPTICLRILNLVILPDPFDPANRAANLFDLGVPSILATLGSAIVFLLMIGVITMAAYDANLRRPPRVGSYLLRTLTAAPVIIILGAVLYLIVLTASLALLLPGLYLLARYWVLTPVILIERGGFSSLSRAADLSAGYRWPMLGAILLAAVVTRIVFLALFMPPVWLMGSELLPLPGHPNYALAALVAAFANSVQFALMSIFTALLYARLRELKEGTGMHDLAAVFE